jgi:hypothetical protein
MTFKEDLEKWIEAEKQFVQYLCTCPNFVWVELSQWKFKDYDIKLTSTDRVVTYEVKSDLKAQETGNYCIEYRYYDKPSGIYTSKADYIVYNVMWQWRMQSRWELLLRLDKLKKSSVKWWDWKKSDLWLLKVDTLPILFDLLDLQTNEVNDDEEAK